MATPQLRGHDRGAYCSSERKPCLDPSSWAPRTLPDAVKGAFGASSGGQMSRDTMM